MVWQAPAAATSTALFIALECWQAAWSAYLINFLSSVYGGTLKTVFGVHFPDSHPNLFVFLVVFFYIPIAPLILPIVRKLWPALDKKVLIPIPDPKPFDPLFGSGLGETVDKEDFVIPWQQPQEPGSRLTAWNQLLKVVGKPLPGSASAAKRGLYYSIWRNPQPDMFRPFAYTVISGRSGTGKTRMAIQFLREELARTAELKRMPVLKRWRIKSKAWWRRTRIWRWSRAPYLHNHPWDVAWIKPEMKPGGKNYEDRKEVHDHYFYNLTAWTPRRPTAFLLDDSSAQDMERAIQSLAIGSPDYKFPVRLFIVSQTLSKSLGFELEGQEIAYDKSYFSGTIIELDDGAQFTDDEMTAIATQRVRKAETPYKYRQANDFEAQLALLIQFSGGNPFLVELALDRLLDGSKLDGLTLPDLVDKRARRIKRRLERGDQVGFSGELFRLVAAFTIAEGSEDSTPGNQTPQSTSARRSELDAKRDSNRSDLFRCLNLNEHGPSGHPHVRPSMWAMLLFGLFLPKTAEITSSACPS